MELDRVERVIVKIMQENGGILPPDFFAKKMQGLVAKGAVEAKFKNAENMYNQHYVYRLVGMK